MRPSFAHINLSALQHNYQQLRQRHTHPLLAVLKANAYGHGATACAQALAPIADGFAVALISEALNLRQAGIPIEQPILVLQGAFDVEELQHASAQHLHLVVHHFAQLEMLIQTPLSAPINIWLKLNSGMNRAGFAPTQFEQVWQQLNTHPNVASLTLMSHFACADDPEHPQTAEQLNCFTAVTQHLPGARSLCNSAGVLAWPQAGENWGRSGIALYGVSPFASSSTTAHHCTALRPVMTLSSAIIAIRSITAGEPVGYGARFSAPCNMRIALVAIGYADGYPRAASGRAVVSIRGRRCPVIGNVSMDMMTVDLTPVPEATIGDIVELWGTQIPVEEVAHAANTIPYELLCNVKRVQFMYHSDVACSLKPRPLVPDE